MTLSRQMIKDLAVARKRPQAVCLGALPDEVVQRAIDFYQKNRDHNILAQAMDNRSARELGVENPAYLTQNYQQVEIQHLEEGGDPSDRRNFVSPADPILMTEIENAVGRCYRSRISVLNPGCSIPRHVDDPSQLRVIAILSGEHEFSLFEKNTTKLLPMGIGELWFVNTAWEHEVTNPYEADRVALLLNLFELPSTYDA